MEVVRWLRAHNTTTTGSSFTYTTGHQLDTATILALRKAARLLAVAENVRQFFTFTDAPPVPAVTASTWTDPSLATLL